MNMAAIARDHFARIVEIPLPALLATRLAGAVAPSLCNVGPARQWGAVLFALLRFAKPKLVGTRERGRRACPRALALISKPAAGRLKYKNILDIK
jgi:hypothetical protein